MPFNPTKAQVEMLRRVEKRAWPAGEPRIDWLNISTARVLFREKLIEEREGTATELRGNIVDLTAAGRAVLASMKDRGTSRAAPERDFELMLRRVCRKLRNSQDPKVQEVVAQALDLLNRKGTASILRDAT